MPRLLVRNNASFVEFPVEARLPKQPFFPVRQLKSFASFARRTSTTQRPLRFRILTTLRLFHIAGQRLLLACTLTSLLGVTLRADPGAEAGFWLDVPFVRQAKNLCGAASVSMVLQYWQKASPAGGSIEVPSFPDIAEALRSSESKGIFGSQMKAYVASLGYQVFVFKGQWEDIKSHISKGRPLIVGLGNRGALDHYVVVAGWSDPESMVLVNDPAQRKLLKLDHKNFQKSWERTACWTLLALPPSLSSAVPTSDGR
jgi:uncharacterized protein YvpB